MIIVEKCSKCGVLVEKEDFYQLNGQEVCEDCAISSHKGPQACDVWAVKIATNTRKQQGLEGTDGLTQRQKEIHDFLDNKKGATLQELLQEFSLSEGELRKEIAVLRHCELARAHQKESGVVFVTWDYKDE